MEIDSLAAKVGMGLDVNLEDKLQVIGIDITDDLGRLVEAVGPGRTYHIKTYIRVLAPMTTEWEGFIHIDGYRRRHNGDHKLAEGKYPLSMWNRDDVVVDDHQFKLEPNFTQGSYTIYFGLYSGETRLKVKSGPHDGDNRIVPGTLASAVAGFRRRSAWSLGGALVPRRPARALREAKREASATSRGPGCADRRCQGSAWRGPFPHDGGEDIANLPDQLNEARGAVGRKAVAKKKESIESKNEKPKQLNLF